MINLYSFPRVHVIFQGTPPEKVSQPIVQNPDFAPDPLALRE